MTNSSIRITFFQAEKMRCASGGQSVPYRVTTYKGPEVGLMGQAPAFIKKMHDVDVGEAANLSDEQFNAQRPLLQKVWHRISGR